MTRPLQSNKYKHKTDRRSVNIVHFGIGAFFRAFCCSYFEKMNCISPASARVMAVSLISADTAYKLSDQGGTFTAVEKSSKGAKAKTIDVIQEPVFAPDSPEKILNMLASESVKLITLTVTEKGYCYHANSGKLDLKNSDIAHDLKNLMRPRSVIGYIAAGLKLRKEKGLRPFTCISCDNLPDNGSILKNAIVQFAQAIDLELSDWIANSGEFPSTMVDRIVPATSKTDIGMLSGVIAYKDVVPVFHEPYSLWVIEDNFTNKGEFPFDAVDIKLVKNVGKFEVMKLRCLNGTHSALAYLGYLSGYDTIFEVISKNIFQRYLERVWKFEILPTINPPDGFVLDCYIEELFERYSNPSIIHKTEQIAMDGSQKLPQRILNTVCDNVHKKRSIVYLCEAIAAWIRYSGGLDERGKKINVIDPLVEKFRVVHKIASNAAELVDFYLTLDVVFPKTLQTNELFRVSLEEALSRQMRYGTLGSLKEVLK